MAVRMDNLSSIPRELIVRITLLQGDLAEVYKILGESTKVAGNLSLNESATGYDVEFKYCEWEQILRALTEYMQAEITAGGFPKAELWRVKNAVSDALIGLQEERINRLNQGES